MFLSRGDGVAVQAFPFWLRFLCHVKKKPRGPVVHSERIERVAMRVIESSFFFSGVFTSRTMLFLLRPQRRSFTRGGARDKG